MRIEFQVVPAWPKLAWVGLYKRQTKALTVMHGPYVEVREDWCAEAVWNDDFAEGRFDRANVVIGTGVKATDEGVVFVSASDMLTRLFHQETNDRIVVSNSLPALLAVANSHLITEFDYHKAISSLIRGELDYVRELPTTTKPVQVTYLNNLYLSSDKLEERPKFDRTPKFGSFTDYRNFLYSVARELGENAGDENRTWPIKTLASVSSGYDSAASALLARQANARSAVTMTEGRRTTANLIDVNDSGHHIARALGLDCQQVERYRKNYPLEDANWAGDGNVGDLILSMFDYPEPLCLLFTGFNGDHVWSVTEKRGALLRRTDTSGSRFSECRLQMGVFNCAPPFWGWRNIHQILDISCSPEMKPWLLGRRYDRPIPRRLLEESGVKREAFGMRKRVSSFNRIYGCPLSKNLRKDFAQFLCAHGQKPVPAFLDVTALCLRSIDRRLVSKLPRPLKLSIGGLITIPDPKWFFIWSNNRCRARYEESL
jgi:hypothetical protein